MIVGCDPGRSGGLVGLDAAGKILGMIAFEVVGKTLKTDKIKKVLRWDGLEHIFFEQTNAFHKGSANASYTFGKYVGHLLGLIDMADIPYTLVRPSVWQKEMFQGTDPKINTKNRAWQACMRLWPEQSFVPEGKRKPSDGLVDAACIAEWGRRRLK